MVEMPTNLIKAAFLSRPNRFTVVADRGGEEVAAYLADSGRLAELLLPGAELYLVPVQGGEKRKTAYDVVLLRRNGIFISLDSRLPNRLFAAAFQSGRLAPFTGYRQLTAEVRAGSSRLDFLLTGGEGREEVSYGAGLPPCYVEVKSVTLVTGGVALFPDAPTMRGSRHLQELMVLRAGGCRVAVVFIIQREDAEIFAPNEATDPLFALNLWQAEKAGVEIYAYRCRINLKMACLGAAVPVFIDFGGGFPIMVP